MFVSLLPLIIWLIGIFILYFVITTAVKHGLNKSVVGQYFAKKLEDNNKQ